MTEIMALTTDNSLHYAIIIGISAEKTQATRLVHSIYIVVKVTGRHKSSIAKRIPVDNILSQFVRLIINYSCSNATEVANCADPSCSRR